METFGKYSLLRKIGSGGMAEVFLARTTVAQGLAKELVIKKIHPSYAQSRQFVAMFIDEARIALRLNHPNVIQVFDFGKEGDTYFLAMEFVDGIDLLALMQACAAAPQPNPLKKKAYIAEQMSKGLDYAHRRVDDDNEALGIVHRDISPQNVLLSWDGGVKIVDFGIARARDMHEEPGTVKGKYAYMSPEQARGEMVDMRTDVFATGICLYEMLTGRPMYPGRGRQVLQQVKVGTFRAPREVNPTIPAGLEEILLRAVAPTVGARYQSARELGANLRRFALEHSRESGELVESTTLAQYLATAVAKPERTREIGLPPPRPATANIGANPRAHGGADATHDVTGSLGLDPGAIKHETRELKHVFVVEGRLPDYQSYAMRVGADRARRFVEQYVNTAKDIIFKHEAMVDNVGFADGRFVLRAVVGVPVASEDDPSRAMRLALALVDALDGIAVENTPELRLAIGVQRGNATVIRSDRSWKFDLDASTSSFAGSLADRAHGAEIIVGGLAYQSARDEWRFEPLATAPLPRELGEGQLARVYLLRGRIERAERQRQRSIGTRMVGRDMELKSIRDAYRDVLISRQKRMVGIVGETGIGKRTLVNAFLATLAPNEATVIRASSQPSTSMTPYGLFADLAREFLSLADGAASAEVMRRIERAVPLVFLGQEETREARGSVQMLGLLVGGVHNVHNQTAAQDAGIDAQERRHRLFQLLLRVEQKFQPDRPLIVILEDMHWSDQETLELFASLLSVNTERPVFGIGTARADQRIKQAMRTASHHTQIVQLSELDEEHRRAYLDEFFVPGEDITQLATEVFARTGGNPYFIRESIEALAQQGVLAVHTGTGSDAGTESSDGMGGGTATGRLSWVRRSSQIPMPSSIETLLAARFDLLEPQVREVLFASSVLGRTIDPSIVAAIVGRNVDVDLRLLIERGLLTQRANDMRFVNDMVMSVAYSLVSPEQRSAFHRQAANILLMQPTYRAGQDDAVVARHLELAGDFVGAVQRYGQAAAHALEMGGNIDAQRLYGRIIRLADPGHHEIRFWAHHGRQESLRQVGQIKDQLRELGAMVREAEALRHPDKLAMAHTCLAQFYFDVHRYAKAERALKVAHEAALGAGHALLQADALRLTAAVHRAKGDLTQAQAVAESALALCEPRAGGVASAGGAPSPAHRTSSSAIMLQRGAILNELGIVLGQRGELEPASDYYAEAVVIYRGLGQQRQEAKSLCNLAIALGALGEHEDAIAQYKLALRIDQSLGNRFGMAVELTNLGQAYARLGDFERAEKCLERATKLCQQIQFHRGLVEIALALGEIAYLQQDFPGAHQRLVSAVAQAKLVGDMSQSLRARLWLALCQTELGMDIPLARNNVQAALAQATAMPMPAGIVFGHAVAALLVARHPKTAGVIETAIVDTHLAGFAAGIAQTAHLEGLELAYWLCRSACVAIGDSQRASEFADQARAALARKLARLTTQELRDSLTQTALAHAINAST